MFKAITNNTLEFPDWFSGKLKAFLSRVLTVNPTKRISFEKMTEDPWISELPEQVLYSLRHEVFGYAPKGHPTAESLAETINFTELLTFSMGKLIFRTVEAGPVLEFENFTTTLSFEELKRKFASIFDKYLTKEITVLQTGRVSIVS